MENSDDVPADLEHPRSQRWAPLWRKYLPDIPSALRALDQLAESDIHAYSIDLRQASSDIERDLQAIHSQPSFERSTTVSTELEDFGSYIRSLIAPIRALPDEILSVVFEHYVGNRRLILAYRDPIWLLLHVSRVWRSVASNTPSLWTKIDTSRITTYVPRVPDARLDSVDMRVVCTVLQSYLSNSSSLPLDIYLCLWPDSRWKPVVEMLWAHRQRWRTLYCRGSRTDELEQVRQDMPSAGLPLLRSYRYASDDIAKDIAGQICFLPAPKFRILQFGGRVQTITQSLPWSQITCYRGPAVTHDGQRILPLMVNLEICDIYVNLSDRVAWGDSAALCFCPRLRVLSFDSSYNEHTCAAYICAPMLWKLRVSGADENPSYFIEITARHGAALSTLSVGYGYDDAILYEILKDCPTLHTLILRQAYYRTPPEPTWRLIFAQLKNDPAMLSHLRVLKVAPAPSLSIEGLNAQLADIMQLVQHLLALDTRRLQAVYIYVHNVDAARRMLDQAYTTVMDTVNVTVHAREEYRHEDDFKELVRPP
ncbi:hypothetical protein EV715DRAFT_210018 [Schizophyllum commune]